MTITPFVVVYLFAAVWRMSNLLANEDGPFHMFKTLRSRIARAEVRSRRKGGLLSKLHLYEGINCEYCNSIWFGSAFALGYWLLGDVILWLLLPLVLSTGAVLIKHLVFLFKSVDTRFDQENQRYLAEKESLENWYKSLETGGPSWDMVPEILEKGGNSNGQ